jgi:hypothetical protein
MQGLFPSPRVVFMSVELSIVGEGGCESSFGPLVFNHVAGEPVVAIEICSFVQLLVTRGWLAIYS